MIYGCDILYWQSKLWNILKKGLTAGLNLCQTLFPWKHFRLRWKENASCVTRQHCLLLVECIWTRRIVSELKKSFQNPETSASVYSMFLLLRDSFEGIWTRPRNCFMGNMKLPQGEVVQPYPYYLNSKPSYQSVQKEEEVENDFWRTKEIKTIILLTVCISCLVLYLLVIPRGPDAN